MGGHYLPLTFPTSRLLLRIAVCIDQLSPRENQILETYLSIASENSGGQQNVATQECGPLGPQARNAQSVSGRYNNLARALGLGADGRRAGQSGYRHRRTARLFLRLLQLCAVRLRTQRLLRTGIFL